MTKVITVAVQKGGVGKTTSVQNISYELSLRGHKILMVDCDHQISLTRAFGINDNSKNIFKCLEGQLNVEDSIVKTEYENLDLIAGSDRFGFAESLMATMMFREKKFSNLFKNIIEQNIYDFILFDVNANMGFVNVSIFNASDYILIPLELSPFGYDGVEDLIDRVEELKENNSNIKILGLLPSIVDYRTAVTKAYEEIVYAKYSFTFKNVIRIDSNVRKSQANNQPIKAFSPSSRATKDFEKVVDEILQKLNS